MRFQSQKIILFLLCFIVLLSFLSFNTMASNAEKTDRWAGVDESVVEKFAKEHGREAHEPIINTDQGDLLLFVFLIAGAIGGFVAGYYWRALTEVKIQKEAKLETENR